jgi:hypothetical protein
MEPRPWIENQTLHENYQCTGGLTELRQHLQSGGSPNIHFGLTSLLYHAADRGHIEAVQLLLDHGADPNGYPRREAPLPPLRNASLRGHLEIVGLLLAAGADVNARDMQGDTPILAARKADHLEVARILLDAGADPTIENAGSESAMNCRYRYAKTDRVGELLRNTTATAIQHQPVDKSSAAGSDPYLLILEMGTAGGNYNVSTEDLLAQLKEWDRIYGITIADVSRDSLRVTFSRLPDSVESLAREIVEFCPDVVSQGFGCYAEMCSHLEETGQEIPREVAELIAGVDLDDEDYGLTLLARALRRDRSVVLWWD